MFYSPRRAAWTHSFFIFTLDYTLWLLSTGWKTGTSSKATGSLPVRIYTELHCSSKVSCATGLQLCHSGNQGSNWFYFLSRLLLHCCTADYRHGNQTCGGLCIIFLYFFLYIISSNPGPISFRPGQRGGTSLSLSLPPLMISFLSSFLVPPNLSLSLSVSG